MNIVYCNTNVQQLENQTGEKRISELSESSSLLLPALTTVQRICELKKTTEKLPALFFSLSVSLSPSLSFHFHSLPQKDPFFLSLGSVGGTRKRYSKPAAGKERERMESVSVGHNFLLLFSLSPSFRLGSLTGLRGSQREKQEKRKFLLHGLRKKEGKIPTPTHSQLFLLGCRKDKIVPGFSLWNFQTSRQKDNKGLSPLKLNVVQ